MNYKEYESAYCVSVEEEDISSLSCQEQYDLENIYNKNRSINQRKSVFISLGNIVIVSLGIYLLNKDKK